MMNGRPISNRKKAQLLVALTILAWATQTLFHQWARGEDVPAGSDAVASERFVPSTARTSAGATLELKDEATVRGGDVLLRQVCRWSKADAQFFAPLADLIIARFQGTAPFQSVSLDEIRRTLRDAGVNLAIIRFAGSTRCTVARGDVKSDDATGLQQWADARSGKVQVATPLETQTPLPAAAVVAGAGSAKPHAGTESKSLRDLLVDDTAIRLNVPIEQLQITFNPVDDKTLNFAEPQFKFNIEAVRVFGLGTVEWNVLVVMESGTRKVPITATARAWVKQVILTRPLAYGQTIQAEDLMEKRTLTDQLSDDPLLTIAQAVGQEGGQRVGKPGQC